ncbi:ead/Ea22-like family protein [Citrobacter sp. CK187]|uniref:ead/Ea22-like family protein n=1 Tax=Citrobacter sp. CK187 TaxID=2985096 RepID=UPI002575B97D|nr:ead/Ea22-like family protein [Citrobacter sp. CK187]ELO4690822.1 ead/Ea22-like family protein [Citrobacter koseri]MDM3014451.1 ead/Ea22-like family protein [Citrobacter sp. CK187]
MSYIDKRALRKAAMHAKTTDDWGCDADNFHDKATPDVVLALLDELEAAEQRNAELVHNHRVHAARLIDERGQLKQRIAELEAREVKIPYLPADCDRTEAHFKYQEAIREAGIEIAAGIGKGA